MKKEALLLEANLIKKYDPKYNILLKDDKRYPYVRLNLKDHPKLEIARSINDKKSKYFGPFSDSTAAYKSIDLLNRIFPLRKCKTLPKEACLYYHLDMCLAPCINNIKKEDYKPYIDKITDFYNGNTKHVRDELNKKMTNYALKLQYEEANKCKIMLSYLDHLVIKQNVELNSNENIDFFSSHFKEGYMSITTFIYRSGNLINKESYSFELVGEMAENFESYIIFYYQNRLKPKEIIVPEFLNAELLNETLEIKVSVAKIGKKKRNTRYGRRKCY